MPTTNSRNLTLTRDGGDVNVNITYNAVFNAFDRNLVGLGLRFLERIDVIGVDPSGSTTGTVLTSFPLQLIPVTNGNVPQTIARNRSINVPRTVLDEDGNPIVDPDAIPDQIRCRIRVVALGLTPAVTEGFTDQEVLEFATQPT